MELGEAAGNRGQVADHAGVEVEAVGQGGDADNSGQRSGDGPGQFGEEMGDRHGQRHQTEQQVKGGAAHPLQNPLGIFNLELAELGQENDDGQAVDKAEHDRMGNQAHELAEPQQAGADLDDAHQHHGGEQVLDPVAGDQIDHDDRQGAGGAGDHPRATADGGGDQADQKGGVKADQRFDPGDKGKGHRFGYQGQGHGQAREYIIFATCGFSDKKFKHHYPYDFRFRFSKAANLICQTAE